MEVDTSISLTWLITFAFSIVTLLGGQWMVLQKALSKLETHDAVQLEILKNLKKSSEEQRELIKGQDKRITKLENAVFKC